MEWLGYGAAVIAGILGTIGSLGAARSAAKSAQNVKQQDVESQAYTRADAITSKLLATLTERVGKLETRLDSAETEVREVRTMNIMLTAFIYKILAIVRHHNLTDEIHPDDVPEGIVV